MKITHVTKQSIRELIPRLLSKAEQLPATEQYRTEYAMQYIGAVLADLTRIEQWEQEVLAWVNDDKVLSDIGPRLKNVLDRKGV